jgi:hypothetical protein
VKTRKPNKAVEATPGSAFGLPFEFLVFKRRRSGVPHLDRSMARALRHIKRLTVRVTSVALLFCAISCATKPVAPPTAQHVSWETAVALLRSGSITGVMQDHSLYVSLESKDGQKYVTREPRIDAVWRVIREVDPKRESIRFITE